MNITLDEDELALIIEALNGYNWERAAISTRAFIENNFMPGPNGDQKIADAESAETRAVSLAARLELGQ